MRVPWHSRAVGGLSGVGRLLPLQDQLTEVRSALQACVAHPPAEPSGF